MPLWDGQPQWQGQDAYLIGGGASLRTFDFSLLTGKNVIGINDAFRLGPEIIKYGFFGDSGYFHRNKWEMETATLDFFTVAETLFSFNLPWCHYVKKQDFGWHQGGNTVAWNWSSGAAAINLAANLGAKRIFLLGYDMALVQGLSHWHGKQIRLTTPDLFVRFDTGFKRLWTELEPFALKGLINVFNVTDGLSKLQYFPRVSFEEFEKGLREPH
jgi:hypothetical protein